jgi:hypothetical protein
VQRLVQAPRARLDVRQDKEPLRRSMGITASSGRVPDDPETRVAAGVLACTQLESATTIVAGIAGVVSPRCRGPNALTDRPVVAGR